MLTIGQVASAAGISASALRFYESVELLPKTNRIGGQRRYSPDILKRIRVIKIAQQAGFQVQEIHTLLEGFDASVPASERWRELAKQKRKELEEKVRLIEQMKQVLDSGLSCTCLSWDECFINMDLSDEVKN
jgi:MerR family redox-sensitive transcriptional activator SoxR